eukprot:866219_1
MLQYSRKTFRLNCDLNNMSTYTLFLLSIIALYSRCSHRYLLEWNPNALWTLGSNSIPYNYTGAATGYYHNEVFLIGPNNEVYVYNITSLTIFDPPTLVTNCFGFVPGIGQFYTQQHDIMYILQTPYMGPSYVSTFNLTTRTYTKVWANVSTLITHNGCLASTTDYLFVIGTIALNKPTFEVLNLDTNEWWNITHVKQPDPNQFRNSPSCVVHNESYLYVIGGHNQRSAEALYIIDNIQNQTWTLYKNALTYSVFGHRSVIYHDIIFNIGGWDDTKDISSNTIGWVTVVQMINITSNNTLTRIPPTENTTANNLQYPIFQAAILIANDVIFAFGGSNGNNFTVRKAVNTWQYINLLSIGYNTTLEPTLHPSVAPTMPTSGPSVYPSQPPTFGSTISDDAEHLQSLFELSIILITSVFVLIGVVGYIDASCVRINDFYRIGTIMQALLHILDMVSDCFLSIDISLRAKENDAFKIPLVISIVHIAIPSVFTLAQVYYYSKTRWNTDNKVREWLLNYSTLLYLLSIGTGSSFTAVAIMNSNTLGLYVFDMGLSNKQMIAFKTQRVYSIVFLENIPQLILQLWYMMKVQETDNYIAIASAIFSGVSILVTVLSGYMETSLIHSQEYTVITMAVIGKSVVTKAEQCKRRVFRLRQEISSLIGLDYRLIEILKPRTIAKGLQIEIHLYVDNEESRKSEYDRLLKDALRDGELAQVVMDSWALSDVPVVSSLDCEYIESIKKRNQMIQQSAISMVTTQKDDSA